MALGVGGGLLGGLLLADAIDDFGDNDNGGAFILCVSAGLSLMD